jgi:hypothetical protein
MQAGEYCAKVQGSSTGEGIAEEEGAEPFWDIILQRHKAEGIVGLGEVYSDRCHTFCCDTDQPMLVECNFLDVVKQDPKIQRQTSITRSMLAMLASSCVTWMTTDHQTPFL